jgi:hypothetical protein
MNKKILVYFFSFIGLFTTYGIAFGLDRWSEYLRQPNASFMSNPPYILWTWSLANIVLAICVFTLYTKALPRLDPWAIWMIIFLGLLIDFLPVLYWLPLGSTLSEFLALSLTRRGYLISVGGFTTIAGVFTLFREKQQNEFHGGVFHS